MLRGSAGTNGAKIQIIIDTPKILRRIIWQLSKKSVFLQRHYEGSEACLGRMNSEGQNESIRLNDDLMKFIALNAPM